MVNRKDKLSISKILVEERRKKGNSQKELATYCGVTNSAVSKWEQGLAYPTLCELPKIADYYGVSIQHLLTGI